MTEPRRHPSARAQKTTVRARPRSASVLAAAIAAASLTAGCSSTPRPQIAIQPERVAADGLPTVGAHVVPNQFPVTDVILEFGRRPGSANAVSILYTSPSYGGVIPSGRPTSPTMQPIDVTFRFTNPGPSGAVVNPFIVGELIDYQFRVTHLDANNAPLFFWSPRKTFQIPPAGPAPPPVIPPGGPGSGGNAACAVPVANVSRPPNGIGGGTTTDLGGDHPSISSDGAFVAFTSRTKFDPNAADVGQIYRREVATGAIVPVTRPANGINGGAVTDSGGRAPSISSDGRFVAFVTRTKFDPNAADVDQVYVRDLQTGDVLRVSTPSGGTTDLGGGSPVISGDGRFVAFVTRTKFDPNAADVDQIYRREVATGAIVPVTRPSNGINGGAVTDAGGRAPSISSDGRFVAFVTRTKFDPNAADVDQVYVRDLQTGGVLRVSTPAGGTTDLGGGGAVISGDGRFVAFVTHTKFDPNAADVDQIYRRDVQSGAIVPVTRPARAIGGGAVTDSGGRAPSISSDGRFVSFVTRTKFDPNSADVDQTYVRDLQTGDVLQVTTPARGISGGSPQDLGGNAPVISGDGRFVAFVSRTRFDANAPEVDEIYRRCLDRP